MLEEEKGNEINQSNSSQPVEDVLADVSSPASSVGSANDQGAVNNLVAESTKEANVEQNLSSMTDDKSSIEPKNDDLSEVKQNNKNNKVLFYSILAIILVLGLFAIWVLVF